jgi:hypothetical protein
MFEGLKARMDRFFADATPPADRRAQAGALRSAIIEARVSVGAMREGVAATERELTIVRQQADDAERRGKLAGGIGDTETVAVAERFLAKHRERVGVFERKLAVQREELALAEREVTEMTAALRDAPADAAGDSIRDAWRELEGAGGVRPETDVNDSLLEAQMDHARRKAAVDEQLAFLKKKMGKE